MKIFENALIFYAVKVYNNRRWNYAKCKLHNKVGSLPKKVNFVFSKLMFCVIIKLL